jgi:hypothetical protein
MDGARSLCIARCTKARLQGRQRLQRPARNHRMRQVSSRDPAVRTTPSTPPYSCEDGVGCVAPTVPEAPAAYAVFGFEMADQGFDGGPAAQLAFDPGGVTPRFWPEM